MSRKTDVYTRNMRGDWFKNGQILRNGPPAKIVRLAANMALQCRVIAKPR